MDESEEKIFTLNTRIKKLIALNEKTLEENQDLQQTNIILKNELRQLANESRKSSETNFQYKQELEKCREKEKNIFDAHNRQKQTFLNLQTQNFKFQDRIKILEEIVKKNGPQVSQNKPPKVQIVSYTNQSELELKVEKLETDLEEAFGIIDSLEFELESLAFYDSENSRLQKEVYELLAEIQELKGNKTDQPADSPEVDVRFDKLELSKDEGEPSNETSFQERRSVLKKRLENLHGK